MTIDDYLEIISECGMSNLVDEYRARGGDMDTQRQNLLNTILEICENVESDSRYYNRIKRGNHGNS